MKKTKEQKEALKVYKARIAKLMEYSKTSEHGLTEDELRKYFGDFCMKSFGNYLDGQTCVLTDDGKCIIYPEDIDRFARNIRFPGPDLWD